MLLCKKILVLGIVSVLSVSTAHAQFKQDGFGSASTMQTENLNGAVSSTPKGIYQKLNGLLGTALYSRLLENDRFLKLQDILVNYMEANYPALFRKKSD